MATARLVASTNAVSNTSYVAVASASNMYTNTDSTSAGTFTHNRASTSNTYYGYLRGFNFSSLPSNAVVSAFTVKIKASATGHTTSTSSSYYMSLCNGTTQIGSTSASGRLSTTTTTFTFANGSLTWDTIVGYGANFGIRIPLRRSAQNTADVVSVYGAEIEVTYTVPTARTITSTLTGSGTISPSGATSKYDGEDYTLTITPTNTSDTVTVKNNNVDVSSQLVEHYTGGTSTSTSQTATGFTTQLSASGANFYTGQNTTGNYFSYAVGHTAESPGYTSASETYVKDGGSNTATGWAIYSFDFSGIPSGADITGVEVKCYGFAASTTHDSTHKANITLRNGSTVKSTEQYFTSTSNQTITISNPGTWTRAELQNAKLYFEVAYYGGGLYGITWKVTYSYGGTLAYYTYTYSVDGDATIAVTIGGGGTIAVTGVSLDKHTTSIVEGGTDTLTATVSPSNATNKTVSWSSGNTSVATVSNGVVTAVSAGTAVITVTTADGGYTDTCAVTVTAPVYTQYRLATSMEVGKSYLIASGNSGSVHMLTNEANGSRTLTGVSATVSNGIISLTDSVASRCLFECVRYTTGNDVTITVKKNNQYLYCDNSNGLRMNAPATLDRFWHYRDNKFWQFKSTSSDGYSDTSSEYKYYLTWSNGNATDNHVSTTSIEDSSIPLIYIFTEYTPSDETMYLKANGAWTEVVDVYKKVNGSWVLQTDLTNVFDNTKNYLKGN